MTILVNYVSRRVTLTLVPHPSSAVANCKKGSRKLIPAITTSLKKSKRGIEGSLLQSRRVVELGSIPDIFPLFPLHHLLFADDDP
jgi:hypothetical protein